MKKILSLIAALILAVSGAAQTSNYGHAASLGSNAADAGGDVVGPASSTNNAFARFSGMTGKLLQDTPDLTYSSPTMSAPDGFVLSSAGSIGLTAGGSNKNITITPSGTGWLNVGSVTGSSGVVAPLLQIAKEASGSSIFPSIELVGYQNGQTAQMFNVIAKAGGTAASPSNASANATIGGYRFYAYANGAFRNVANLSVATNATFGSSDFSSNISLGPSISSGQVTLLRMDGAANTFFSGTTIGGNNTPNLSSTLLIDWGGNGKTTNALSSTGVFLAVAGRTATDNVSSGTVATAVANSFAVPTFAASSSTTFTNAANLYIAGDVTNGSNVTLTNSYGLWNVGKTRLDGPLVQPPSALTYASPTTVNVALASVYTVTTVNATGSVTFNASAGGTAGQQMTILITNDATSAKTITFGTNFLSTGTLTASAASRHTSITFCSDGTNWYETGRAVLTN